MGDLGASLSTTEYFSGVLNQQPLFITKISQAPVGIRAQVATMKRAYLRVRIPSQLCGSYRHVTIINNCLCGTHGRRERGSRLSGRKAIWSGERTKLTSRFIFADASWRQTAHSAVVTCVVYTLNLSPSPFLVLPGGFLGNGETG